MYDPVGPFKVGNEPKKFIQDSQIIIGLSQDIMITQLEWMSINRQNLIATLYNHLPTDIMN